MEEPEGGQPEGEVEANALHDGLNGGRLGYEKRGNPKLAVKEEPSPYL